MTVSDFIAELGGNLAAAKLFKVTRPAVCNWKAANKLPARLHLRAHLIAGEKRIRFDPQRPTRARSK
jgi:hypothetical protein